MIAFGDLGNHDQEHHFTQNADLTPYVWVVQVGGGGGGGGEIPYLFRP